MLRKLMFLSLGLALAVPAWSQVPPECPPDLIVPVRLSVPDPCPGRPLFLRGDACGPCVDFLGWSADSLGPIRIGAGMDLRNCLITVCMPESVLVPIGPFAPGHYTLSVEIDGRVIQSNGSACSATRKQDVTFDVPLECPAPANPLPYVETIRIGPPPPCATCSPMPICPGLEIPFQIGGVLPNSCYQFHGLQLVPDPRMDPFPHPPMAVVTIGVDDCRDVPCLDVPQPWQAAARLPGLPPGANSMLVQLVEVSICDTTHTPLRTYGTAVPFIVADRCSIPPPPPGEGCFLADWRHDPERPQCDAIVGPGEPARLVFQVQSGVALAGLEGRIALLPPALGITEIRPVGPAVGMRLAWNPLADGAKFVLFTEGGAHIPPSLPCSPGAPCGPVPVLEVTAAVRPGMPPPPQTLARMLELIAADSLGRTVGFCPTFAVVDMVARICAAGGLCDANGDGVLDVRDLVLMVRCIRGVGDCPDSSRARFDCNRDSTVTVDDVMCCALRILRGDLPDSLTPHRVAGLRLAFDAPVPTSSGVDLPLRLQGADHLGAARLQFSCPTGYALLGVELPGAPSGWLHVEEGSAGQVRVGLIGMQPASASELQVLIHFGVPAGQSPTGPVTLAAAEFADVDGAAVTPSDGVLGIAIGGAPRMELSAARPNPMTRETRFELSLTQASDVRLGVYDLSGRLVSGLWHGRLDAGGHSFTWNGTRGDGTRAADGMYFYRARGAGLQATRRLVLMRGN